MGTRLSTRHSSTGSQVLNEVQSPATRGVHRSGSGRHALRSSSCFGRRPKLDDEDDGNSGGNDRLLTAEEKIQETPSSTVLKGSDEANNEAFMQSTLASEDAVDFRDLKSRLDDEENEIRFIDDLADPGLPVGDVSRMSSVVDPGGPRDQDGSLVSYGGAGDRSMGCGGTDRGAAGEMGLSLTSLTSGDLMTDFDGDSCMESFTRRSSLDTSQFYASMCSLISML